MTDATEGARTVYPSRAPEFTTGFSVVRVARSFVFCVGCCRSLSVLPFTDSDYPFGIFKLFLIHLFMTMYWCNRIVEWVLSQT